MKLPLRSLQRFWQPLFAELAGAEPNATVLAFRAAAERHGARFLLGQAASEILVERDKFVGIRIGKERI